MDYGWVPPGQTRSITADEVYYGVLDRLGRHGYAFFYFRDPAATARMVETKPGEYRELEGCENEQRLKELKVAIDHAGLNPFIYPAQWDNEAKRMTRLTQFGKRVYTDLMLSINHEFGEQPAENLDEFAEENAAMEVFIAERTQHFVLGSRKSIWNELIAHVNSRDHNKSLCLVGEPGSGKSALLAQFSQHLTLTAQPHVLLIHHFVGASIGSTNPRRTLRRLCNEMINGTGVTADILEEIEKLCIAFPEILKQASSQKLVIIILDAINQFDPTPQFAGLLWFPEQLPDNVRLIFSTVPDATIDDLRRFRYPPREVILPVLTSADGKSIIREFFHRYRKTMTDEAAGDAAGHNRCR